MFTVVLPIALLVTSAADCPPGPENMRCVAGGAVVVGAAELQRNVTVDRFFIDDDVVSADAYRKCVEARACEPATMKGKQHDKPVAVDWARAERYCAFAGKRLAQESEWEAAVLAGVKPVGEEWTNTWAVDAKTCPSASALIEKASKESYFPRAFCGAKDVLDACDGAVLCGTLHKRVWKDAATPNARHDASSLENGAQKAFRCATSYPYLTKFPSKFAASQEAPTTRPKPADPAPPTADELAKFNSVVEDTLDVPPCPKVGRSFLTCRDPRSYLKSNEPRVGVLLPYVENMGGAYTGVASDQNYTFVALARSQWAWLFDYDWNVVRWHHVLRAMILDSADRASFIDHFRAKSIKHGLEVIEATYKDDPAEVKLLQELYKASAVSLVDNYVWQSKQPYTWLASDEHYGYVRLLYQQGRMRAMRGNMLDVHAMKTIGDAAKALNVPMRLYYPSNAPEFWEFSKEYRDNVRNFPFDDDSVVIQTISGISLKTGFGQTGYWHYNVQYGHEQQTLLSQPGLTRLKQLLWHRVKTDSTEVTICGLPMENAK